MPQHRRRFLQQLAVATAVVASARVSRAYAGPDWKDGPRLDAFTGRLGADFTATHGSGATTVLKLAEVARPRSFAGYPDPVRASELCFTLVFDCDAGAALPEAIYTLDAPGIASFEAFMSPVGKSGRRYQVVFNRI